MSRAPRCRYFCRIHGGPNAQDQHSFQFERHFLLANGYAVLAVNYRGSCWSRTEVLTGDLCRLGPLLRLMICWLASTTLVKIGVADPARLGVGGWSYGGILTDYLIAE
jgi:dipeptidyl aminopeptidase/acylaminoacyl peptidase